MSFFSKNTLPCQEAESPSTPLQNSNQSKVDFVTVAIAVFGFFVSVYALYEHIQAKAGHAGKLSCDINSTISCTTILTSDYGEIFNIPLGAFGMAFWLGIFAVGILPALAQVSKKYMAGWRLLSASIGFLTALTLAYIAYVVLRGVCLICSTIQVTCLVYFIYSLVMYIKHKNHAAEVSPNAFPRLLSMVLLLGCLPLIIGLIFTPIAIEAIAKQQSKETQPATGAKPIVATTPIPKELLQIAKTNYVGNGEDYRMGNDNAKVVITVFTDPECPACRMASNAFDAALKTVGLDKVLLVVHFYPLDNSCNAKVQNTVHPQACNVASAIRCAGQQGKFWDLLHWAYDSQALQGAERAQAYSDPGLRAKAKELGLNMDAFNQCYSSGVEMPKIKDDIELGNKLNLTGTPMVIINNKRFEGNHGNPTDLVNAIEAELQL